MKVIDLWDMTPGSWYLSTALNDITSCRQTYAHPLSWALHISFKKTATSVHINSDIILAQIKTFRAEVMPCNFTGQYPPT